MATNDQDTNSPPDRVEESIRRAMNKYAFEIATVAKEETERYSEPCVIILSEKNIIEFFSNVLIDSWHGPGEASDTALQVLKLGGVDVSNDIYGVVIPIGKMRIIAARSEADGFPSAGEEILDIMDLAMEISNTGIVPVALAAPGGIGLYGLEEEDLDG